MNASDAGARRNLLQAPQGRLPPQDLGADHCETEAAARRNDSRHRCLSWQARPISRSAGPCGLAGFDSSPGEAVTREELSRRDWIGGI